MLTPPVVRFVRAFDIMELRVVHFWHWLKTQAQIDMSPLAVDCCIVAPTVAEVIQELRKFTEGPKPILSEFEFQQIVKSSESIPDAPPAIVRCYDCKRETCDYVMEERQISGGPAGPMGSGDTVMAGDLARVPVHANRRECRG
jgi:hypothetical protein